MQTKSNPKTAVVWSQIGCTYCGSAKKLLEAKGISYIEKTIGTDATRDEFFQAVPNARTVPQIFIDGEYIGGFNELTKALHSDNIKTIKVL